MLWNERTLKYPEVGSWWPFLELHLVFDNPSALPQSHHSQSGQWVLWNFHCFHCCTCTSGHGAKTLGTRNSWKSGSRVEDWIIDEDKTVRTVFLFLLNSCVVGGLSHTASTWALLLTVYTTLYPLQHFSFCSFWKAGKLSAFKAACVWCSTQITSPDHKKEEFPADRFVLGLCMSWA